MSKIDTYSDPVLQEWPLSGSVIIIDLEYTSWKGSLERNWSDDGEFREIIQLGAVKAKVNNQGFSKEGSFERLVKPVKNPLLSDHFVNLTGISNSMLSTHACGFSEALDEFGRFSSDISQIWSIGFDGEVLRENAILNQISYPFKRDMVYNIRPALAKVLGLPESSVISCKLPELVGLSPSVKQHSALDDTLSIHRALKHLRKKGFI